MGDMGARVDAAGFHEPLVDRCSDVPARRIDAEGEVCGIEAARAAEP
ncbi:hypothetical protein [Streptomyces sp. NPDC005283]